MQDCGNDVLAYHDEKVTLSQPQRTAMRDRRDANRDRLVVRLKAEGKPTPHEFIKQGSYAMLTMVQDPDNDYDIDDGVYFTQESLRDTQGKDMPPAAARQIVRDALCDERFTKQPEVKTSCVRIYYQEGHHVDMPTYRIREADGEYELAAGDKWVVSRAADVEDWFDQVSQSKSPDTSNGRQFRRIVRDLKKFARSRSDWKDQIATGFTITKLAEECYVPDAEREDLALRQTMKRIRNRLLLSLEVDHPVTPGAKLTSGAADATMLFLRDKLDTALTALAVLDDPNCARAQALAAWDSVYGIDFFSARAVAKAESVSTASNAAILANLVSTKQDPRAVDKRGGGRFA